MPVPTPAATATVTAPAGSLKLRGDKTQPSSGSFPELEAKGYTVVPNVISAERAAEYVDRMYKWLESFGLGFKGDDRSTWHMENLPHFDKGGLYHRYGVGHEQFAWDIRSEPALIDVFARIWGTEELLVSYDSVNISLPFPAEELGETRGKAWPHTDQSPTRRYKHCVQGIMNLYPNGPLDGGLMVLEGSMPLFNEFFETHPELEPAEGYSTADFWSHHEDMVQWFYDRGCKWKKVEAGPGDVILWDSRTVHYGDVARGTEPRVATYVCYKPAKDITPEKLALKQQCFAEAWGTSHDPLEFRINSPANKNWQLAENDRLRPLKEPVLSDRAKQLAGLVPY